MNLAFLDENFQLIKYFKAINLQWIRRYYEPGEFSVQLPVAEYVDGAAYVFADERPELGIAQKREYADGYDGDVIQVSGYFYEYKLNDKITYPRYQGYGNIEKVAQEIVKTYKEDIPLLCLGGLNDPPLGISITKQSTGDGLATVLYGMLKTQELSFRCSYNYEENKIFFSVWQGKDRTQDQRVNSFATFSEGMRNVQNEEIVIDSSNFKNYGVVIGNGKYEDGQQIEVIVDLRSGPDIYAQKLYIDKTNMTFDSTKQTLGEFREQLRQAGMEEMAKYNDITSVKFDVIDKGLTYMESYDLGDKCDAILDSVSQAYMVRITEAHEVFKDSKHRVTLQFGEKVPTVYNKARR